MRREDGQRGFSRQVHRTRTRRRPGGIARPISAVRRRGGPALPRSESHRRSPSDRLFGARRAADAYSDVCRLKQRRVALDGLDRLSERKADRRLGDQVERAVRTDVRKNLERAAEVGHRRRMESDSIMKAELLQIVEARHLAVARSPVHGVGVCQQGAAPNRRRPGPRCRRSMRSSSPPSWRKSVASFRRRRFGSRTASGGGRDAGAARRVPPPGAFRSRAKSPAAAAQDGGTGLPEMIDGRGRCRGQALRPLPSHHRQAQAAGDATLRRESTGSSPASGREKGSLSCRRLGARDPCESGST